MVKSRSVKPNAKNARGLGRDRAAKIKQPKSLLNRKEEVYVLKEDKENVLDSHQRANNADQK